MLDWWIRAHMGRNESKRDKSQAAELAKSYGLLTETAVMRRNKTKVYVQLNWTLAQLRHLEFLVYLWEQDRIGGPKG